MHETRSSKNYQKVNKNIEDKIKILQQESAKLRKDLPVSKKDYAKHKGESKKLVTIIELNNKKRKEFKDTITKLNKELRNLKDKKIELNKSDDVLKQKQKYIEELDNELLIIANECKTLQDQLHEKE